MNPVRTVRERLKMTQAALGAAIGCTQGNVGHYETGRQTLPPKAANKLIALARSRGVQATYEDFYGQPGRSPRSS